MVDTYIFLAYVACALLALPVAISWADVKNQGSPVGMVFAVIVSMVLAALWPLCVLYAPFVIYDKARGFSERVASVEAMAVQARSDIIDLIYVRPEDPVSNERICGLYQRIESLEAKIETLKKPKKRK